MNLTLDTKLVVSPQIVSTDIDQKAVILQLENSLYFGMNPIGSEILERLSEPQSIDSLVNYILSEYDVDRQTCEQDIFTLAGQLLEHELVIVVP